MGLSFEQYPVKAADKLPAITNWTPLIGYMLYQSDVAGYFYHKLILEIRLTDASGTLLGKIKQRRNGYDDDITNNKARAYFDLRDIVNTQLVDTLYDQNQSGVPFESIHTLGTNTGATAKIFSQSGDIQLGKTQLATIYVKGYEEYSSSASASPTEQTGDAQNDTKYYIQASLPLFTERSVTGGSVDTDFLQGDAFEIYQPDAATKRFLSDTPSFANEYSSSAVYTNYVIDNSKADEGDYHTVAFLNGTTDLGSDVTSIRIQYFNSSGSQIGSNQTFTNSNANGGAIPASEVNTDAERLIYFGCGPGNLETQTTTAAAQPSNFDGWAYYIIQGLNVSAAVSTAPYYFIKQDGSCKGYAVRRLAWRNSLGAWDYFNFKKKSTQTVNVDRNNYSSMLGTFNKSKWRYDDYQRGKNTRQTTAVLRETLNTDWIPEAQADMIEKCLMSTNVQIVENDNSTYTQSVMITSSSHVRKTTANDGMKIQYTIEIEYANNLNTNS